MCNRSEGQGSRVKVVSKTEEVFLATKTLLLTFKLAFHQQFDQGIILGFNVTYDREAL